MFYMPFFTSLELAKRKYDRLHWSNMVVFGNILYVNFGVFVLRMRDGIQSGDSEQLILK